jgi:ribosomal protein S27AE
VRCSLPPHPVYFAMDSSTPLLDPNLFSPRANKRRRPDDTVTLPPQKLSRTSKENIPCASEQNTVAANKCQQGDKCRDCQKVVQSVNSHRDHCARKVANCVYPSLLDSGPTTTVSLHRDSNGRFTCGRCGQALKKASGMQVRSRLKIIISH